MIVGFTGFKGCGKDSAAAFAPYVKIYKFADPLKAMLSAYLKYRDYSTEDIYEALEGSTKEVKQDAFCGHDPRWAMQTLGTEWGRDLIGPDIWLDTMEHRLAISITKQRAAKHPEVIAVTDVRFLNEAALIYKMGGKLIRISRPGYEPEAVTHQSEAEMRLIIPSTTIVNDGTIEDLRQKVKRYIGV